MRELHFVVPDAIDDPGRPSGGNTYDRRLAHGLRAAGWSVHEHAVGGFWSEPDAQSFAALDRVVRRFGDDATVLLDGLVASTAPQVLVPQAQRPRLVVLVHMPLGDRPRDDGGDGRASEQAVLSAAAAVVATSEWSRSRLLALYSLEAERVHVATPGVDPAGISAATAAGRSLVCVAAVTPDKGHDLLLDALAGIGDLAWSCTCVGPLDRDPAFVERLRARALDCGLAERISFPGVRTGADLDRAYASADLLVSASRAETYGMAIVEALARAVPVVATDVGGVAEALGGDPHGVRPGLLVPPAHRALSDALRTWLSDRELRARLRRAARARRESLPSWASTTAAVDGVLRAVSS